MSGGFCMHPGPNSALRGGIGMIHSLECFTVSALSRKAETAHKSAEICAHESPGTRGDSGVIGGQHACCSHPIPFT